MFSNCFPLRRQSGKNHSKIGGLDWSPHATTASGSTRRPDVNEEQVNRNPYVLQSLEESFLKGYGFCGPVRLKRYERNEKLKKTRKKSPPKKGGGSYILRYVRVCRRTLHLGALKQMENRGGFLGLTQKQPKPKQPIAKGYGF